MTLSFRQAFLAKQNGKISWDEYLHTLLTSWTGVKHEEERTQGWHTDLQNLDPFAHSIWLWSMRCEDVKDTGPLEALFKAYRQSTLDDVKDKFARLNGQPANGVIRALAVLSLQDRQAEVLQFCTNSLDRSSTGAYDMNFHKEANKVDEKKDPAVFDVLERSDFRKVFPRGEVYVPKPTENNEEVGAGPGAAADFDKGGRFPVNW